VRRALVQADGRSVLVRRADVDSPWSPDNAKWGKLVGALRRGGREEDDEEVGVDEEARVGCGHRGFSDPPCSF
jgi:hypothetical protein